MYLTLIFSIDPTTATVFTSTVLANSTDTILLSCQLFGDPLPTNITWLYTYAASKPNCYATNISITMTAFSSLFIITVLQITPVL